MQDQRNLILAIVLSVAILLGWNLLLPTAPPEPSGTTETTGVPNVGAPGSDPGQVAEDLLAQSATREDAIAADPRIVVDSPRLHGSVSLVGARIDDLTLADYNVTVEDGSPEVVLLSPRTAPNAYFADFGWAAEAGVETPDSETVWEADRETLTPGNPVTLSWTNPAGIVFEQELAIDENYLFTVTQRVTNGSEEPLAIRPYGRVWRYGTPVVEGWFILHEGPIGVFDSTLDELDYEDIAEEGTLTETSTGGWLGFTDKYWLVSLVPDQASAVEAQFIHTRPGSQDRYASTIAYDTVAVAAGESHEMTSRLFAGAKEVDVIDAYQEVYGIDNFIYSIDWGWFYFITQPFFYAIDWIASHVGNFGVAILIFTVLVKLVFFPLANKSYKSMSRMKALQPQMMQIRERFKDDRQKMNQALMEMYRREKVNPASGCLPILVQIPVFFALYKVLFVTIEMRHAPFFGWIRDLAAMDPTSLWNLFGLIPWEPETVLPPFLLLPAWPIFMGVTMWAQMKLNPAPTDPIQKRIIGAFPFVFTFLLSTFPAGLVIYWTWNNMLSMLQQYVIMKRMGVKIGGGVDKTAPATQPNLPPSVRRKQERAKKAQEGEDAAPAPEPANDSQARRGQSGKRKRR